MHNAESSWRIRRYRLESAQAPTCARGHDAPLMARATRAAEPRGRRQGEPTDPHQESNNPATIIPDMRHMARYGSG
jgi:hypothetical protein